MEHAGGAGAGEGAFGADASRREDAAAGVCGAIDGIERTDAHADGDTDDKGMFRLKALRSLASNTPGMDGGSIVLQNVNGPCPLLGAINCLVLRGAMELPAGARAAGFVDLDTLIALLADRILNLTDAQSSPGDSGLDANARQNVADAITLLPTLADGLDVNCRFSTISDFEFTPVFSIFDILNIRVLHGWIVDPADEHTSAAVAGRSYNQIVERIIELGSRPPPDGIASPRATAVAAGSATGDAVGGGGGVGAVPQASASAPVRVEGVPMPAGDEEEQAQLKIAMAMSLAEATDLIDFADEGDDEQQAGAEACGTTGADDRLDGQQAAGAAAHMEQGDRGASVDLDDPESIVRRVVDDIVSGVEGTHIGGTESEGLADGGEGAAAREESGKTAEAEEKEPDDDGGATALTCAEFNELTALQAFLSTTASQLTYAGLMALHEGMKPGEYAVLFRNNHFSTVFKEGGHIYSLVTDEGFAREDELVWERLSALDGDTRFYNCEFEAYTNAASSEVPMAGAAAIADAPGNVLVNEAEHGVGGGSVGAGGSDADLALAMHLQAQEEAAAEAEERRRHMHAAEEAASGPGGGQPPPQPQQQQMRYGRPRPHSSRASSSSESNGGNNKSTNCTIQ